MNLFVALLGAAVGSRGQLAPLVRHEVGSRCKCQGIQLEQLAPSGHGSYASVGHVGRHLAAQTPSLLANLSLHRGLPRLCRRALARLSHQVQHRRRLGPGAHLFHDVRLLVVVLRACQSGAPYHTRAGLEKLLDEVELVVVEEEHEPVLARALVIRLASQRGEHLLRHLGRLSRVRVGVPESRGHLPLEPVGVDVRGFHDVLVVLLAVVAADVHTLHAAAKLSLLPSALVILLHVARLQDLVQLVILLVVLVLLLELDGHADVVIEGIARDNIALAGAAARVEISDELTDGDKLRKLLAARRTHQGFDVLLPLRVCLVVVLQYLEDLIGGAPEHVLRLVSKLALDHSQECLVRSPGLPRLRAVGPVGVSSEHAGHGLGPALLASSVQGVQIVLVHPALTPLSRALLAILELGGLVAVHSVAELAGLDATPERLGLAGGLASHAVLVIGREHEARVLRGVGNKDGRSANASGWRGGRRLDYGGGVARCANSPLGTRTACNARGPRRHRP